LNPANPIPRAHLQFDDPEHPAAPYIRINPSAIATIDPAKEFDVAIFALKADADLPVACDIHASSIQAARAPVTVSVATRATPAALEIEVGIRDPSTAIAPAVIPAIVPTAVRIILVPAAPRPIPSTNVASASRTVAGAIVVVVTKDTAAASAAKPAPAATPEDIERIALPTALVVFDSHDRPPAILSRPQQFLPPSSVDPLEPEVHRPIRHRLVANEPPDCSWRPVNGSDRHIAAEDIHFRHIVHPHFDCAFPFTSTSTDVSAALIGNTLPIQAHDGKGRDKENLLFHGLADHKFN